MQIYISTKINNKVCTLKEMLMQTDKEEFIKVMHEEVESIFKENIWKGVPKKLMGKYYAEQREKVIKINREQQMMISSF